MPLYKQLRRKPKSQAPLPFYRPIDRLTYYFIENKRIWKPIGIALVLALIGFGAIKGYAAYYEGKADELLAQKDLPKLVQDYPRSKASLVARMKLGRESLDKGNSDEAIRWYEKVAEKSSAPALLRVAALQNIALAYLKKNEFEKSLATLEKAKHDPKNANSDYTELLIARVHEAAGEEEKAQGIYKVLAEGAKDPTIKQAANERGTWPKTPETQETQKVPSK